MRLPVAIIVLLALIHTSAAQDGEDYDLDGVMNMMGKMYGKMKLANRKICERKCECCCPHDMLAMDYSCCFCPVQKTIVIVCTVFVFFACILAYAAFCLLRPGCPWHRKHNPNHTHYRPLEPLKPEDDEV